MTVVVKPDNDLLHATCSWCFPKFIRRSTTRILVPLVLPPCIFDQDNFTKRVHLDCMYRCLGGCVQCIINIIIIIIIIINAHN
jgi:hypothetical protein